MFLAIRPDRDKTGRQKNPRRGGGMYENVTSRKGASCNDLPCVTPEKDCGDLSDDARSSSHSSRADSISTDLKGSPQPIGDLSVLSTLCEIEHICNQLRDAHPVMSRTSITLLDAILRPSLITPRSPVRFDFHKI